ncbi:MAG: FHA domain-containing protein [Pirellulaceae bacterium]|nr:FHA domain-containing protein [Pirellulaceae bacterium]
MQAEITTPNGAVGANQRALILSVTGENGWVTEYRLMMEATVIIGSASQCGLSLVGDDVSAMHCSLRWDEKGIWLEDWSSRNGTFLDGEKVTSEVPAELRSTICVGTYTISLGFDAPQPSQADAATNKTAGAGDLTDPEVELSPLASFTNRPVASEDVSAKVPNLVRESSLPVAHNGGPARVQSDACDQETFDILRAEIEQLQFEAAERDAQLAEALATEHESETTVDGDSVNQLMERLEALLDELDRSDERMATLEELLRVTEEANRDEREERRQMESWLGDIESVFSEHEATWNAEMTELRNRTTAIASERDQLLQQMTQPAADDHAEQEAEEIVKLRLQIKHLQQRVDEATAFGTRQQEELRRREAELDEVAKTENTHREDHLKLAAERASLSRMRAEMAAEQRDGQQQMQDARTETVIDSRVRGFRQHLREIHDEENQGDNEQSLSSRISRLWKRIDAHR